jgi:hypothetical protein
MYLRKVHIRNLKLLRDVAIDFTGADGKPRPFTVFVGENGTCKTSLLQAIALVASGADRANQLAEAGSYLDLRRPKVGVEVEALFSFPGHYRGYPGYGAEDLSPAPWIRAHLRVDPGFDVFRSTSAYEDEHGAPFEPHDVHVTPEDIAEREALSDPLSEARGQNLSRWFVAAYGVSRTLPVPASVSSDEIASPTRDRLLSLFKATRIIGTGFADLFSPEFAAAFTAELAKVFVEHGVLPHATGLSLLKRGHIKNAAERVRAHRLALNWNGHAVEVPTIWLSQGYQAMIAWVADLVGQASWEDEMGDVSPDTMEGICLVDEIDLHLHPQWQAGIIGALRAAFPKVQFIATTHSPMVLPGLRPEEIFNLQQDAEGNVVVQPAAEPPALMTGSELYRRFFGIERAQPRALHDKLFAYATLATYPGRSEAEEQEVWRLRAELHAAGVRPDIEPEPRKVAAKKRPATAKRVSSRRKG